MKKRQLRCIIAGFDPFGKGTFNPSGDIAQAFPDTLDVRGHGTFAVEKLLLPTCCTQSWKVLNKALKKFQNDDVVLVITGLAETRNSISLERVALNLRDYRITDNNGHQHKASKILASDENALFTEVSVDALKSVMLKKGIPCEVSNHAGAFVCNEIYFRALSHQQEFENLKAVLFIHLPLPKNFANAIAQTKKKPQLKSAAKKQSTKRAQLAMLQECVQMAVEYCVKHAV